MQQVKIFKSIESELWNMEEEINNWLSETGATVVSITGNIAAQTAPSAAGGIGGGAGSFSASDVLIVVLYEK